MAQYTKRKSREFVQVSYDNGRHWKSTRYRTVEEALEAEKTGNRTFRSWTKGLYDMDGEWAMQQMALGKRVEKFEMTMYRSRLEHYMIPRFGDMLMTEIKAKDINEWFLHVKGYRHNEELSSATKNALLFQLRQILDFALLNGVVQVNEGKKVKQMVYKLKKEQKYLSPDELAILFPEDPNLIASIFGSVRMGLFFSIMYDTGFRPSEILALRRDNIRADGSVYTESMYDSHTGRLVHRIKTTNRGKRYKVGRLSQNSMHLYDLYKPIDYLFYSEKNTLTEQHTNRIFKSVLKRMFGYEGFSQKCLRHAFATRMSIRYPKEIVMEMMGHTKWEPTYDDRTGDQMIESLKTALSRCQA